MFRLFSPNCCGTKIQGQGSIDRNLNILSINGKTHSPQCSKWCKLQRDENYSNYFLKTKAKINFIKVIKYTCPGLQKVKVNM